MPPLHKQVDFRARRKTFITNLSKSGASPKTAQLFARHSDINLTMNVYTALELSDQAIAVELLPKLPTLLPAPDPTTKVLGIFEHLAKLRERAVRKVPGKNKSV